MSYQPDRHTRSILPIPNQVWHGLTTYDAKDPDTHFPPIRELRPPEGAPNVLIVLLDDVGFGDGYEALLAYDEPGESRQRAGAAARSLWRRRWLAGDRRGL